MTDERRPTAEEIPGQKLPYPARQVDMDPAPDSDLSNYQPAGKLKGKTALITGGDSGIGRAVAIAFALEGADVAIFYNENDDDAHTTQAMVKAKGRRCSVIRGDVRQSQDCRAAVERVIAELGGLNILVNNAAYQMAQARFEDVSEEQFRRTLETNIFGYFYMVKAALPHLTTGDAIVNTGSIVGLVGNQLLVDYCASKGAIHAFTKALALNLAERGIRVNAVVPGPVWTPNIPGTMPIEEVEHFGHEVALARPGQPEELAPAYVFLASSDASFVTGSLLEVTGGKLSSG
ncbi:MAG: SDR family oxidoreductase [Herpetosiphonaceae bacterium]|nr:SDR family oxidoreductase [Herpetosiphonaceae bacterium]